MVQASPRQACAVASSLRQYAKRAKSGMVLQMVPAPPGSASPVSSSGAMESRRPERARPTVPGRSSHSSGGHTVNCASVDP